MRRTLTALGFGLLAVGAAHAEERQARIEVSGLWCASCSFIVGKALQKSDSVEIVDFAPDDSGETAVYTVTFDDALTTLEEIAAQPATYGYTAVVLDDASST
jgi:mercuric ion binding protein